MAEPSESAVSKTAVKDPASSLANSRDEAELSSLMTKAQDGDKVAYRTLLRRVQELIIPFIRNHLRRAGILGDPVLEDVLQEALLGIHAKRATYDRNQYFLPWMYGITRYKAIDAMRDLKKRRALSIDDEAVWGTLTAPEKDEGSAIDAEQLLTDLSEKQQTVMRLVKIDGLSIQEASLKTGFSSSDIKVTVHRAIKSLQKKLAKVQL